jgi:hypothetical protein
MRTVETNDNKLVCSVLYRMDNRGQRFIKIIDLERSLTQEACALLRQDGLDVVAGGTSQRGGGAGMLSLLSTIITLIGTAIEISRTLISIRTNTLEADLAPRMEVRLWFKHVQKPGEALLASYDLAAMIYAAITTATVLGSKHPLLRFDAIITAQNANLEASVEFTLPAGHQNKYDIARILQRVKDWQPIKQSHATYRVVNAFVIKKTLTLPIYKKGARNGNKRKNYYLITSNRVLAEYGLWQVWRRWLYKIK